MIDPIRLYRDEGEDRIAVVSVTPAYAQEGQWLVRLARGAKSGQLHAGQVYGPYASEVLRERFDEVVAELRGEGFDTSGLALSLTELQDENRRRRALTALRLGWRGNRRAAPALLQAAEDAKEEICPMLDALGYLGDPEAIPFVRRFAERKLLSRRRSGVEALRNLGDEEGLAQARERNVAALEEPLRQALEAVDEDDRTGAAAEKLAKAVKSLPAKRRGRAADNLYELATPAAVDAARRVLAALPFDRAFVWRYVKSVWKRSTLRHDAVTFGELAQRIERAAAHSYGITAKVKSGRDGQIRDTPIFKKKTQHYMMRAAWRYLRDLARYHPQLYARTAAEALIHYEHSDAAEPKGRYGAFSRCYLLHRILWGASRRFEFLDQRMRFRFIGKAVQAPPEAREESFPFLWDAEPKAYLRLLSAARLPEIQQFALEAVEKRHPELVGEASLEELKGMLGAVLPVIAELALAELQRRFDPDHPNWTLLLHLAEDERDWVRAVAADWLERTAPQWTRHADPVMSWLDATHPDVRAQAAQLTAEAMPTAAPELRAVLAERLLERLLAPETEEGRHDIYARVAVELAAEIDPRLELDEVLRLIEKGSNGAKAVAGAMLGLRPAALGEIGTARVLALAEHEVLTVRAAARSLLYGNRTTLESDPSLLLVVIESDWDDNRDFALRLLRDEIDLAGLGLDGLVALCDSNRVDVQDVGRELLLRHFSEVDRSAATWRLSEHPHRNMRRFAFDLIEKHLEPGAKALEELGPFFRKVLFDLRPERRLKERVVAFLTRRGLAARDEAAVAVAVLGDAARSHGRADFDRALHALTLLRFEYPDLDSPVELELAS